MVQRPFWVEAIDQAWKKRSLVWLAGVRRVGKTTLAKMFHEAIYLNCDLPSVTRKLEDPEIFFQSISPGRIIKSARPSTWSLHIMAEAGEN